MKRQKFSHVELERMAKENLGISEPIDDESDKALDELMERLHVDDVS